MAENQEQENLALQVKKMEYELSPAGQEQRKFDVIARKANMLAATTIIPDAYKNNPGNCAIAVEMSERMNCNPLMVMQNLYIVHGQPSFSSKFLIAAINATGRFSPLDYEWKGEERAKNWSCRATAKRLVDGKELHGAWVSMEMAFKEGWATKNGSKWQTMPELMLMYRAAAFFQRVYAPEVSMGFISTEEVEDTYGGKAQKTQGITDFVEAEVVATRQSEQEDVVEPQQPTDAETARNTDGTLFDENK